MQRRQFLASLLGLPLAATLSPVTIVITASDRSIAALAQEMMGREKYNWSVTADGVLEYSIP